MFKIKRIFLLLFIGVVSSTCMNAQTFNWVGFTTTTNSATRTFTNGNMTAVVSAVNGGGVTGYSNGSGSQIGGSGVCAGTPTGLFLEMSGASMAWNNYINIAITFAVPVCAPATFTIYDINEDIWFDGVSTNYSNYDDQVTIGATDQTLTAIAPANILYAGCAVAGNTSTAGNNKILRGRWTSNGCSCSAATVIINGGGQMIKTINILYNNCQPPTYAKYGICQYQDIVISPITVSAPPTASITAPALLCGSSTTTLTVTTSAGSPTYVWTGPGTIASPSSASTSVTGAGTYTVTINPGGCSATATYTVSPSGVLPNVSATAAQTVTCANSTITASSSSSPVSFSWAGPGIVSGGATTTPTINAAGTYTVTVTNTSTGCTSTATVTATLNTTPPAVSSASSNTINCTNPNTTLTGTSAGNTMVWNGGSLSNAANPATVNAAGTYTVTATDAANGCTAISTVIVNGNTTPPVVLSSSSGNITCAISSVTLTGTSAGNTMVWNGGALSNASNPATVTTAGTYTVTATDASNGCAATSTVTVTASGAIPNISISSPPQFTCSNTSVTLTGNSSTAGVTYLWTGGPATTTYTVNTASTYTLTVTDPGNGCSASQTVTVTSNTAPPVVTSSSSGNITCAISSVTLTGTSAGNTMVWNGGALSNASNPATVNAAGTYTVTATDASNGCTASATVSVTASGAIPNISIATPQQLTCTNTSVTLIGNSTTASVTYLWTGGPATTTYTVNTSSTYTLTVTDPGNGCSASQTVTVISNITPPVVTSASSGNITCSVSTVTLTGTSAGNTMVWNGGALSNASNPATVNIAGIYIVTATNPSNGCTATSSVTVSNSGGPTVSISSQTNVNCNGSNTGSATATGSGGTGVLNYTWSGGGGNNATASNLSAGTYTVTVTDATGCSNSTNVTITQGNLITVTATSTPANCGTITGTATASATGGTGVLTYLWSAPGGTTSTINNLGAGTYTVTITDGLGCSQTASTTVSSTGGPSVDAGTNLMITAGSSTVLYGSGPAGATFSWSPSSTLSCSTCANTLATPTQTTTYTLTVTLNGCSSSDTVTVFMDMLCGELFVPTAFSPNGDSQNDILYVFGNCITDLEFAIFDRWGEKVFETQDEAKGWDGRYNGKDLNAASFAYYLNATVKGEAIKKHGSITLVK